MMRKGISPLIAAVLLIAFTMAVAGILATWATQFVQTESESAAEEQKCVGSLLLNSPTFDAESLNVSVTVSNLNSQINMTGLKAFLEYTDPNKNKQYAIADVSLAPTEKKTVSFTSDYAVKPKSIEVVSTECPKYPVKMSFR